MQASILPGFSDASSLRLMKSLSLTVRQADVATATVTRLVLAASSPEVLPEVLPGQFAEVRIDDTPGVLLRRPISIHDYDAAAGTITMLVQRVGKGTAWLCSRRPGDEVNVVMPLGKGFTLPEPLAEGRVAPRYLLVGGGVGVAPLLLLGKELTRRGADVTFLLGARTENDLPCLVRYEQAARTLVSTENGGAGERGFVTDHSVWQREAFDQICACGPLPMMKAVARRAVALGVPCEVSLENRMACGLGACLCCVEDTVDGHVCVCREGPVFDIRRLKWDCSVDK